VAVKAADCPEQRVDVLADSVADRALLVVTSAVEGEAIVAKGWLVLLSVMVIAALPAAVGKAVTVKVALLAPSGITTVAGREE
jgi:hypothetical protein